MKEIYFFNSNVVTTTTQRTQTVVVVPDQLNLSNSGHWNDPRPIVLAKASHLKTILKANQYIPIKPTLCVSVI